MVKKKGEFYRFEVVGSFYSEFPTDMLRYDQCWPMHEDGKIPSTFRHNRVPDDERLPVKIELVGLNAPTKDRWKSFGWKVTRIDGVPQ